MYPGRFTHLAKRPVFSRSRAFRPVRVHGAEAAAPGEVAATPTTDEKRLPTVLQNTSGFVYYVSITGITGAADAVAGDVGPEVARIKASTDLPVVVGFGIKTPEAAERIASVSDGAVVGSAIVERIGRGDSAADVLAFVKTLSDGAHRA